jgi:PKD repeat protein
VNDLEVLGFTIETNDQPVTDSILDRNQYSVYVIPNPGGGPTSDPAEFTPSELAAIQNFVLKGGGLFLIGDERQEDVLASITGFAGINWTDSSGSGESQEIVPHEVTQDVDSVVISNTIARIFTDTSDALAVVNHSVGANTMCAVSEPTGYDGRVAGFADEDSLEDGGVDAGDNLELAINIILWLAQGGFVNSLPTSLGIIPQSNGVMRNESISIYGNAEDLDEPEYMLTAFFEYKAPSSGSWETTYLTTASYDNNTNRWWISFEPPNDAELGFYDFRIQFMDSEGAESNYSYSNDSVEVKNNEPEALDLTIDYNEVLRTQSVYIYANASDLENVEDVLTAEFQHRDEMGSWVGDYFEGDLTYITMGSEGFWRITFTPPYDAMLGEYDFRVNFTDSDGGYSNWMEVEDVLDVLNNPPLAIDIYSQSSELLRGDTVTIYAKGEDIEDAEDMLTPNIKHKSPITGYISDLYLSALSWDIFENAWSMEFTPDLNAELGIYNFSVQFTDSNSDMSEIIYFEGILVKNSKPIAEDITVAQWVLRDGSVEFTANGFDLEDQEDDLIPHFSYKAPGSPDFEDAFFSALKHEDDQWIVKFSPDKSSEAGSYIIRILFEDEDGSLSESIQDSCQVRNNPPEAGDIRVSATSLFRTDTIIIRSKGNDIEDDQSDLVATFQYKLSSGTSWKSSDLENPDFNSGTGYHTIEFTPTKQADSGDYDFRVTFEDTDGDDSSWVYKNESVEVKTKPPEVTDISISADEVLREESIYIYADVSDLEDPIGDLNPHFEYQNPNTGAWEDDYLDSETVDGDQVRITFNPPGSAPLGSYYFRVRFSDSDGDLSDWEESRDSVYVENNPPEVTITTGVSQDSLEVTFTATVSDVEDSISKLDFRWVFGDGDTSTKQSPTHTYDEEGTYDITLRITDSDDEEVFDEITITIDVAGGDGDGDGVDGGETDDGGFNMMLLLGILLPIIVVVLLVVLLLARKKKKEEEIPEAVSAEVVAAPSVPQAAVQVPTAAQPAVYVPQQRQAPTPVTAPTPTPKVAAKKPGLKNIKCPRCKHTFGVEAKEGQTIMVQCPSCGAKGQMKF